ncbi:alpha/beta hydrolase [Tessaracoccus antarcticus]|uniref:alpha/beta hydrolase n=1 Tax=Tessaracoccus antarcticus TaxID=2479848 RepID=UPI00131434A5|nr:alpha/beta hydrolase-fold protein [Tessaracoccus antarcticus]
MTFDQSSQGALGDFQVYLPPCYAAAPGSRYPVVYLLHGSGHDDAYWLEVGIVGAADDAIGHGKVAPMILVMPDGGPTFGTGRGGETFATFLTSELIPRVDASYRSIATRSGRAIGGISLGGGLALTIAAGAPTLFTAVGGHSPAVRDPAALAAHLTAGGLRVWLDVGAGDSLRDGSISLEKELRGLGGDVHLEVPEGTHVDSYWTAHLAEYLHFYDQSFRASR